MNYKFLLASLLPFTAFSMEKEEQENKIKAVQITTTKEQCAWVEAMRWLVLQYKDASTATKCLDQIKQLLKDPRAQECINKETENIKETVLNTACHNNITDIAELFLNAGADPNTISSASQQTPLLAACTRETHSFSEIDCSSIVQLLINKGALVNTPCGNTLRTPLHRAVHKSTIDILLQAGADIQIKDKLGVTPLVGHAIDMGRYHKNKDMFKESIKAIEEFVPSFLRYGANVYEKDPASGKTAYELLKPYMPDLDAIIENSKEIR
jgi:hypothetical protein